MSICTRKRFLQSKQANHAGRCEFLFLNSLRLNFYTNRRKPFCKCTTLQVLLFSDFQFRVGNFACCAVAGQARMDSARRVSLNWRACRRRRHFAASDRTQSIRRGLAGVAGGAWVEDRPVRRIADVASS